MFNSKTSITQCNIAGTCVENFYPAGNINTPHAQGTNYRIKMTILNYAKAKALQLLDDAICDSENLSIIKRNKSRIEQFKSFCCSISVFVRTHLLNFHKFLRSGQTHMCWEGRDDGGGEARGSFIDLEYAEQKLFGDFSYQIFKSN